MMSDPVSIDKVPPSFTDLWDPRIVAQAGGFDIRVAKDSAQDVSAVGTVRAVIPRAVGRYTATAAPEMHCSDAVAAVEYGPTRNSAPRADCPTAATAFPMIASRSSGTRLVTTWPKRRHATMGTVSAAESKIGAWLGTRQHPA